MTLTINLPDEAAGRFQREANARGLDLTAFAVAAMDEASDANTNAEDDGPDMEIVAAALEAIEDSRAGRLLTIEEADARFEQDLTEARERVRAKIHAGDFPTLSGAFV